MDEHIQTLRDLDLPEGLLKPSRHALDDEFERHPDDVGHVATALAMAKLERDEYAIEASKVALRVKREVLDAREPGQKMTVDEIKSRVELDPEVRKTTRDMAKHDFKVERIAACLKALEAKTSALKHLSELWQSGYFTSSTGRAPTTRRGRDE